MVHIRCWTCSVSGFMFSTSLNKADEHGYELGCYQHLMMSCLSLSEMHESGGLKQLAPALTVCLSCRKA
jgi:hypothetical protein